MSTYYTGKRAQHYNKRWHTFTARMLEETKEVIDVAPLFTLSTSSPRS
jgi:hypothetical protein